MLAQYIKDWGMTLAAFVIAFYYYLTRRQKYAVTWLQLFIVAIILAIGGTIGNSVASLLTQGNWGGRRAYGMVLFNTLVLLPASTLLKRNDGTLTDFAAIPAAAICLVGKTQCLIEGCCYGITLFTTANGTEYLFPSQLFEEVFLFAIVITLLRLEKTGNAQGFLWSLNILWYGLSRYLADLFRGNPNERETYLFNLPAGRFWSLIIIFIGFYLLYITFKKRYGRLPSFTEFLSAAAGNYPD